MRHLTTVFLIFLLCPAMATAEERSFRLSAPAALIETGVLKHLLPRFTLKNSIRITLVTHGDPAEARLNSDGAGQVVFIGPVSIWHLQLLDDSGGGFADRFRDWLISDVGKRTIESFEPDGKAMFSVQITQPEAVVETVFEGDAVLGEKLAMQHCGRCHVINDSNRMKAIGSTPSFGLLRTFKDWDERFQTFYTLNPHPSFTQISDVTAPFAANAPPPIVPLELTTGDLEAILAFVTSVPPADLGAPISHQ